MAPQTASAFGHHSYISVSEYRLAPTAVATTALVAKSTNQQQDSSWSLAKIIERASSWADLIAFHVPDGSFAATLHNDSMWVTPKSDGSLALICNFKPVLECVGLALGLAPSQLANIDATSAADLWIEGKIITIPGWWNAPVSNGPAVPFARPANLMGRIYAVYSYVSGYPLTTLTANALANATTITVAPSVPGGTTVVGIYAGTPLTINDGDSTETVTATAAPSGLTVAVTALANAHTIPQAPDSIRVSALPRAVEQATISLTSALIKTQGSRAMQMPSAPGGMPGKPQMALAGALGDYETACSLLKSLVTSIMH